jgi:hypothetical protein
MSGLIEITTNHCIMGEFDNRYPYLKRNDASPNFYLVAGATIAFGNAGGQLTWTYKVPGLQVSDYPQDGHTAPVMPTNTSVPVSY